MTLTFETKKVVFEQPSTSSISAPVSVTFPTDIKTVQVALQSFQFKPSGAREVGELEVDLVPVTFSGRTATSEARITFYATQTSMPISEAYCRVLFIADCE